MARYIELDAVVVELEKIEKALKNACKPNPFGNVEECMTAAELQTLDVVKETINTLEVKDIDIDVSKISENLAEAYEYLGYTQTSNLAHNKPMVSARLKWAIQSLFDAGMFELTHDKKYRMESLGLKVQKGE